MISGPRRRVRRSGLIAAGVAAALAALVLLGWAARIEVLRSIVPGRPPGLPLTSIVILVLAIGSVAHASPTASLARRVLAKTCGALAVAFGLLVASEYLLGWTFVGEPLLFSRDLPEVFPGRPSPPTAIAFVLLGGALLVHDVVVGRRRFRPAVWLSAAAAYVALIALTGHAFGTGMLYHYRWQPVIGMAIPVALAVIALAAAIVLVRPDVDVMRVIVSRAGGGRMARRLLPVAVLAPPLAGAFVELVERLGIQDRPLAVGLLAASSVPVVAALVLLDARSINRVEARARAQIEQIGRASAKVSEAVASLASTDLEALLRTIVKETQRITGARYGAIGIAGEQPDDELEHVVTVGVPEEVLQAIRRGPVSRDSLRGLLQQGRIVRVRAEPDQPPLLGVAGSYAMSSLLVVPLRHRGRVVGYLLLAEKRNGREFTEEDERVAELLADRVGTALETARLYAVEATGRAWLQNVIDHAPDAVFVADPSGAVTSMNRSARELVCADCDARRPVDLRRPDRTPLAEDEWPLARALEHARGSVGVELLVCGREGREIPVLVSATPVLGGSGEVLGAVLVLRDVSVMKEMERMREQWTSIVAHDLRQPVGVIMLAATMISGRDVECLSPPHRRALDAIVRAATNLDRMIHDLLDASRIEAHRMTIVAERMDVDAWLRGVVERAAAATRGAPVRLEIDGALPPISGDPGRLEQVLVNLLSNAAKYGEPGAEVGVAVSTSDDAVEIAVTNRGKGLTKKEIEGLFSRYGRTASGRASREGIGLGLYIARGLVEAHAGTLVVESTPGVETTFRITLPAIEATGEDGRPSRPSRGRRSRPSA
jgi:PAS domain S-box-containing protein